jgi:predicted nuclease of predicted toxin-antitoxin system
MIKLLLNENFPAPSVRRLEEHGLDIVAIREACPGWKDEQVLARAVEEGRWIVTFDSDYGDLVFHQGLPPPPAIVLLRESHYRPAEPAEWVLGLAGASDECVGRFVVFTRERIRTRPLLQVV